MGHKKSLVVKRSPGTVDMTQQLILPDYSFTIKEYIGHQSFLIMFTISYCLKAGMNGPKAITWNLTRDGARAIYRLFAILFPRPALILYTSTDFPIGKIL